MGRYFPDDEAPELQRAMKEAPKEKNHHAISNLERALATYKTRNRVYGDNYKRFGAIMQSLFPSGVTIDSEHQWNRFGILIQEISKLSRYVTDPYNGHIDSGHDAGVYWFMLEELDSKQAGLDVTPPIPLLTTVDRKEALPNPCEHVYRDADPDAYRAHRQLFIETGTGKKYCIACGEEEGAR